MVTVWFAVPAACTANAAAIIAQHVTILPAAFIFLLLWFA
jgi:hypothetical protein